MPDAEKRVRISRRKFIGSVAGGVVVGAAGAWGLSRGIARLGDDPARPPDLYEYFLDNFWFKTVDLYGQKINPPLKGSHKADIVIIGGGYTGLSSAYHLMQKFPDKKIVLLEGACCGYGASGRNGGQVSAGHPGLREISESEQALKLYDAAQYGVRLISRLQSEEGLECDFEATGHLVTAMNEDQAKVLEKYHERNKSLGLESTLMHGKELEAEIKSPRYLAGLRNSDGGIVNPAKLVRGLKPIVENGGVEIRERTVVMRVTPGKVHRVETEMGEISAPVLVLGLNGYSHKIGFFRNRAIPLGTYMIATEPLSEAQWESVGWQNRQAIYDMRWDFDYMRPTADGRIAIGGSDILYYANDRLSSGNNPPVIRTLTKSLFDTFPQLEGLRIAHAWGGTFAWTIDLTPSVGIIGDHKNLYYGVAYSGSGVGFGMMAGRIITDLMSGDPSVLTALSVVNHKIPYVGPQSLRIIPARILKWYAMHQSTGWAD